MGKKLNKKLLTVESVCTCVCLKFYAEQCGVTREFPLPLETQYDIMSDFIDVLQADNTYDIRGIVHDMDKEEDIDSFFVPAFVKPHGHLIVKSKAMRADGRGLQGFRIGTLLKYFEDIYDFSYDADLDLELVKHGGIIPLNVNKDEDIRMTVYLTHETYECNNTPKFVYSHSSIITNLSSFELEQIYLEYNNTLNGSKGKRNFVELTPDMKILKYHKADEYARSGKSFEEFKDKELRFEDKQYKTFIDTCKQYFDDALRETILAHPNVNRVAIYITSPKSMGKSWCTEEVLEEVTGIKPYKISESAGKKNGCTDNYRNRASIFYDDIFCDCPLDMCDKKANELYVRNRGNLPFNGDYTVQLSNRPFTGKNSYIEYCEHLGYDNEQIEAIKSRIFVIQIYLDGTVRFECPNECREITDDGVRSIIRKFLDFAVPFKKKIEFVKHSKENRKFTDKEIFEQELERYEMSSDSIVSYTSDFTDIHEEDLPYEWTKQFEEDLIKYGGYGYDELFTVCHEC